MRAIISKWRNLGMKADLCHGKLASMVMVWGCFAASGLEYIIIDRTMNFDLDKKILMAKR